MSSKKLIVLFLIAIILISMFTWHHQSRKKAYFNRCMEMRMIDMALNNHIDAVKKLPPLSISEPNQEERSWRFAIAPYMGYGSGYPEENAAKYFDFAKRWDEEPNVSLWIPAYNWLGRPKSSDDYQRYWANVMAVTGPDTAFEIREPLLLEGCEDMILVVEVANSKVHWGQPGDLDIANLPENLTLGIDGDGIMVLFWDGSVWFIKKEVPMERLKHFFTATDARRHDRDKELKPYAKVYYDAQAKQSAAD